MSIGLVEFYQTKTFNQNNNFSAQRTNSAKARLSYALYASVMSVETRCPIQLMPKNKPYL